MHACVYFYWNQWLLLTEVLFFNFFKIFLPFHLPKADCFSITFRDLHINSMTFQAWKLILIIYSMTFQVFQDLKKLCLCSQSKITTLRLLRLGQLITCNTLHGPSNGKEWFSTKKFPTTQNVCQQYGNQQQNQSKCIGTDCYFPEHRGDSSKNPFIKWAVSWVSPCIYLLQGHKLLLEAKS